MGHIGELRSWRLVRAGALGAGAAILAIAGLLGAVLVLERYDCERCRARRGVRGRRWGTNS
jgi:hypothetical protein